MFSLLFCFFVYFSLGSALIPSITIVCRIDTLEKHSLAPKCIGFAVLKLCVDSSGEQPGPNSTDARIYLNAGQYKLPIVYGKVPAEGNFSESLMDTLPHIHNAYLNVRLFDPHVDTPASARPDDGGWHQMRDHTKLVDDTSVAGTLIHAFPYATVPLRKFPISEGILHDIKSGYVIGEGEKNIVIRQVAEWIAQAFPHLKQKIPLIDPRFMTKYEDRVGTFCALDMLYNMPIRKDILRATKDAIERDKKFDNHIKYYKTYFRYLPGYFESEIGSPKKEQMADMILDDASLDLDLDSFEYNPVFNDDFSRTVGIELTPAACLLVVVTAVDILTTSRPDPISSSGNGQSRAAVSRTGTRGMEGGGGGGRTKEEERAFKLRGLVGAYFGNHEAEAVWWGIVPLLLESPFEKRETRATKLKSMLPVVHALNAMKSGRNMMGGSFKGGSFSEPQNDMVMKFVREGSSKKLNVKVNQWTIDDSPNKRSSPVKRQGSFIATDSSVMDEKIFFVNAGTHQVPLFSGFPPEDLMKAANPMAWLLSNLATGVKSNDELQQNVSSGFLGCFSSKAVVDPTDAEYNARRGKPILSLCPGGSAMISITDPRLRQFSNNSLTKDPTVIVREDTMNRVLRARFLKHNPQTRTKFVDDQKRLNAYNLFKYKKITKTDKRTYAQAIPHNIYTETLLEEISRKFIQSISE